MTEHATLERQAAQRMGERERAALRRLGALMRAEATELAPGDWVAARLDPEVHLRDWGERLLPELSRLMVVEEPEGPNPWARRRSDRCPLNEEQEACLRRLAVLLRAEAAELGRASPLGRRLGGWGIRLALECEDPERAPGLV